MADATPDELAVSTLHGLRRQVADAEGRAARAKDEWAEAAEQLGRLQQAILSLEAYLTARGITLPIDKDVNGSEPAGATSDRLLALMAENPGAEWSLQQLVRTFKDRRWDLQLGHTEDTVRAATGRLAKDGAIIRVRPGVFKLGLRGGDEQLETETTGGQRALLANEAGRYPPS